MVVGGVADAVMVLLVVALLLKLFLVLIPSMVVGLLVWVLPIGTAAAGVDARAVVLISMVLVALLVMLLKPWVLLLVMFLFGRDGVGGGVTVDVLNAVVNDGFDGDVAVGVEMPVIALPV